MDCTICGLMEDRAWETRETETTPFSGFSGASHEERIARETSLDRNIKKKKQDADSAGAEDVEREESESRRKAPKIEERDAPTTCSGSG